MGGDDARQCQVGRIKVHNALDTRALDTRMSGEKGRQVVRALSEIFNGRPVVLLAPIAVAVTAITPKRIIAIAPRVDV